MLTCRQTDIFGTTLFVDKIFIWIKWLRFLLTLRESPNGLGIDWSLLNDGMTIPVSVCSLFRAWDKSILTHGQSKDIKILIDGEFYDAKLKTRTSCRATGRGIRTSFRFAMAANRCWPSNCVPRSRRVMRTCMCRNSNRRRTSGRFHCSTTCWSTSGSIWPRRPTCSAWSIAQVQSQEVPVRIPEWRGAEVETVWAFEGIIRFLMCQNLNRG